MKSNTPASKVRLVQSLASASGALAATVATSQAATVQITLTGNQLSGGVNTLNADLTGDGTDDIIIGATSRGSALARVDINNNRLSARRSTYWYSGTTYTPPTKNVYFYAAVQFAAGGTGVPYRSGGTANNIKYLNPISFMDARINGGAMTQGYLEINAFNSELSNQTVALTRLVFDDASTILSTDGLSTSATYATWTTVPEPSSLGLLALGAGGLLARRRRQAA